MTNNCQGYVHFGTWKCLIYASFLDFKGLVARLLYQESGSAAYLVKACTRKCKCKNHFYCTPYRLTEGALQTVGL